MYKQSNEAKLAYQSAERTLDIVVNVNGVDYKANDIEQFDYDSGGYTGDTFSIGSTYENNITVKFIHLVEGLKRGMIVKPRIGIKLPNGTFEYTPLGIFIIADEIQMDRNNNSTTIKAYDKFVVMEGQYVSKLTYPANAVDIITEIAQMCKVDVNTNDLAHLPTIKVSKAITKQSYRTAIGWIAQLYVGFASFDRDGKLTIRRVSEPNYTIEPSEYEQQGLVKNEAPYIIGGISCNVNVVETTNNGETSETTHKIHSGSVNGSQIELTNDIMTQELLDSIWNSLKTITFYPFSLNWFGNPAIEAGDWLSLKDMKGNVFVVPNNGYTISFNGGLSSTSKADQNATDSSTVKYTGELTRAIENYSRRQAPDGTNIYTDVKEPTDAKFNDVWFKPNGNSTELWIFERQSNGTGKWVKQPVNGEVEQKINDTLKDFDELDKSFKDNASTQSATNELMKSRIDSISNQIPNLSDEISRVNGSVTSLKTQTDKDRQQLQSTSQNLDQARQDLLSNSDRIDKLSIQTDKDRQQLQTTSQNLDKARQDVLSNSSRIDKLSVGLDSVNINVNNVNSKVDNIKVGGVNLVRNSAHDPSNLDHWITNGVGKVWYATHSLFRNNTTKMFFLGNNTNQEMLIQTEYMDIEPDTDYTLSMVVFGASGVSSGDVYYNIKYADGSNTYFNVDRAFKYNPSRAERKVYKFHTSPNSSGSKATQVFVRVDNNGLIPGYSDATSMLGDVKLEKGNVATDWSPAPEDEIERVAQLKVDLNGMNATVATNKGDIAQIKLTETGMQQSIKDAQGNISTLQNDSKQFKQQFQDVNGNITTIKNDAKSLSSQLSTKVGTSEYNSFKEQTAQELRTKLTASDLSGYAKSADVKVSVDGLKARFDNLNVGGTNLVRNSGNPQNISGWHANGSTDILTVTKHPYWKNGQENLFLFINRNTNGNESVFGSDLFKVERNTNYTLSYWAFEDSYVSNSDTYFFGRKNGESNFTITKKLVRERKYSIGHAEYVNVTFSTGDCDEGYIRFDNNGNSGNNQSGLYIANIKLEKGTIATDWSPAPEDIDSSIESAKSIATQTKDGFDRLTQKTGYNASTGEFAKVTTQINEGIKGVSSEVKSVSNRLDNLSVGGTNLLKGTSHDLQRKSTTNDWVRLPYNTDFFRSIYPLDNFTAKVWIEKPNKDSWLQAYVGGNGLFKGNVIKAGQSGYSEVHGTLNKDITGANLVIGAGDRVSVSLSWKELKLEKGNVPTDWSPAPEDLQEGINIATTKATQTDTKFERMISQIQYNDSTGEIGKYEHKITELSNGTQEKISALTKRGNNMVIKSSFDDGTDLGGWYVASVYGSDFYRTTTTPKPDEMSSNYCLASGTRDALEANNIFPVTSGTKYYISAWVYTSQKYSGKVGLYVKNSNNNNKTWLGATVPKDNQNRWIKVKNTITIPNGYNIAQPWLQVEKMVSDNEKIYFADISITRADDNAIELSETMTTRIGDLERTVRTNTTNIGQYRQEMTNSAKEWSLKLTSYQNLVLNDISGVKNGIGGTNLVRNGAYNSNDTSHWTTNGKGRLYVLKHTYIKNSSVNHFGLENNTNNEMIIYSDWIDVQPNTDYTLSYYRYGYSSVSSGDTYIQFKHGDGATRWQGVENGYKFSPRYAEYKKFTFRTDGSDKQLQLRFDNNGGGDCMFAAIKLEKGTIATDWSPAPEDTDNKIEVLSGKITANSNEFSTVYSKITNAKNDAINTIKGDSQWQSMGKIVTNAAFLQSSDGFAQEVSKTTTPMVSGGGVNLAAKTSKDLQNVNVTGTWIFVGHKSSSYFNDLSSYQGKHITVRVWIERPTADAWVQIWTNKVNGLFKGNVIKAGQSGYSTASGVIPTGFTDWNIPVGGGAQKMSFGWKELKIELGEVATPWSPAPEDLATKLQLNQVIDTADSHTRTISDYLTGSNSRFVQMANYLNMNVGNSSVSVNGNGVMLSGNRIKITGKTLIDNAVILDALIKDINANTVKTKTLDASKINVTNLNANNITSGAISGTNLNINLDSGDVSFQKGVLYNNKNLKIDLTNGFLEIQDTKKTRGLLITDGNIFISKDLSSIDPSKQIANIGYNGGNGIDLDVFNVGKMSFTYSEIVDKSNNVSLETRPVNWRSKYYLGPQLYMKAGEYKNTHTFAIRTNGDGLGASILGNNDKITISASDVSISKIKYTYIENLDATNLHVYGSKNSVVPSSKGYIAINAYETAEYYFGDIGESQTDKQGVKIINLDPLFLETVNTSVPYQVFLSSYDDAKVWVFARNDNMFIVKSDKPNVKFAWEIKAKRKDYENVRLETVDLKNERN